jgi:hypothetical protein
MYLQQGDVLIEKSPIPEAAKKSSKNRIVLAEGESTGHAHVITDTDNCTAFETDEALYLRVINEVEVKHEEHKIITLPPGDYKVRKVQEYDHFKEEARKVQD